jgi:hypothetical protein
MNRKLTLTIAIVSLMGLLSACGGTSTLSRKDACVTLSKELQTFFNSTASFKDGSVSLSLGLGVLKLDLDEELKKDVTDYQDLIDKVDYTTTTNEAFQALVEQKHVDALNGMKSKCSAEGISIG